MNRLRRCLSCLMLLLAAAGPAIAAQATAAATPPRYKVVAYYLASSMPARYVSPMKIPASRITHLNYAFAGITDGEIVVGDPALDTSGPDNFARLRELKKRHRHLKTLISVGGWLGSASFSDVALTPESRARFADSGVAFIRKHGFDGIDVDWEFPVSGGMPGNVRRPQDKENFTLLLKAMRQKLDAAGRADRRRYLLTAAVGNNEDYLRNTEIRAVAAQLDWMNLMAYDMNGTWNKVAGHLAPLYHDPEQVSPGGPNLRNNVADLVGQYLAAGVPPRQLVLGVPFYGYSWRQCGAARNGEYQSCEGPGRGSWEQGALDYSDIESQLVNRNGFTRHWNAAAHAPYVYNPQTGEFVSYEDPESLRAKLHFIKQRRLGGAMFWELTSDRGHQLLGTLAKALLPPGGP
ncbi:MAG TPA: glycoside hydrolase family 18 protein [Albitalea sp.]|uniref:glycoside hydrolase family 18 protein n=1 Tax=Piscinibacter sp. TaxID=1903157 RepID=UPI002ED459CD